MDSLTLMDYSDRELLHLVLDCQDAETGYATTEAVTAALGMEGERRHQSVGVRLAWLRRFGAVTKDSKRSRWAVTQIGEQLINGELTERQAALLADAEEDRLLVMTRAMASRYRRAGTTAGHLIRREWKRGTTW